MLRDRPPQQPGLGRVLAADNPNNPIVDLAGVDD
jgi:hypothetical protein